MDIKEVYEKIGGNYDTLTKRIPSAALIVKFVGKFLNDGSFKSLVDAMEAGNVKEAFTAAHTLKGVCGNLSLDRLYNSASTLTEMLRNADGVMPEGAFDALEVIKQDYQQCVDVINQFLAA
ncbi:MAG: Hpt domain-containing protein [Erysipelotrichaceae bacterium]|nr:Hpt domain-containing protein [Erysipelotrichaceae bacterium]